MIPPTEAHMRARKIAYENHFLYEMQMCRVLPTVNMNHCLLEFVFASDVVQDVDEFRKRHHDWIARVAWIGNVVALASLFVEQALARTILGCLHPCLSLPHLVLVLGTSNSDLARLTTQFWQFWLVMVVSLLMGLTFGVVLRDARATTGVVFFLTMLTMLLSDANIKSRTVQSGFLLASWPILAAIVLVMLVHGAKAAVFTTFPVLNIQVADTEFLLLAGLLLCTYTFPRLVDSWSWVRHASNRNDVHCLSIQPLHEIVIISSAKQPSAARNVEGDLCGQRPTTHGLSQLVMTRLHPTSVDSRKTMVHPFQIPPPRYLMVIPWLGYCGMVLVIAAFVLMRWDAGAFHKLQHAVGLAALFVSLLFYLNHALWYQRHLLRMLVLDVDCVFVTLEFTVLTLCACDTFRWNHRALFCGTAFVWHHWYLCLDTLPAITKSVLRCRIWFRTVVQVFLLVYLMVIAQWLFLSKPVYADTPESLQNRVLIDVPVYESTQPQTRFRVRCVGVLVISVVVHFFWMLRGIWRQLTLRPNTFRHLQSKVRLSLGLHSSKTAPIRKYIVRARDNSNHMLLTTKSITRASTVRTLRSWNSTKVFATNN